MNMCGAGLVAGKERRQNYSQLSVLSIRLVLLNGENWERDK